MLRKRRPTRPAPSSLGLRRPCTRSAMGRRPSVARRPVLAQVVRSRRQLEPARTSASARSSAAILQALDTSEARSWPIARPAHQPAARRACVCDADARPHRRTPRGGTRQAAIAARQARVAGRRSGDTNGQCWSDAGGPMNGEGPYLCESHPMDCTRLVGTRDKAAWRVAREAAASSRESDRCGAGRGDGALADARSSGSYWASP
jgi:hypothetical protein